jgi:hypothetical protein
MELKGSHVYKAQIDRVMTMLADKSATTDKYASMGDRDIDIIDLVADDESLRIVSSRQVEVELPAFAKKALKPTNTMVQTDEWHRQPDGSWSGTFDVDVKGAPVHISGRMDLSPTAEGSRHDVVLDVQVKVPLIGGKIAEWVGKKEVQRTLDAEFAFNDGRLAPA